MGNATKMEHGLVHTPGLLGSNRVHTHRATHSTALMRGFDLCVGAFLVALFFPSMIMLGVATMVFNKGRGFRMVSKVTQGGHFVTVLNFYASNRSDSSGVFNRFMVNSRLAKLPEIVNVVTGELSLFNPARAKPALFVM